MPFKILIDTCVWLDLAKDYQQQAILAALEELIRHGKVELILPRTVIDEFGRNRARIIEESGRSFSSTLKRVKGAVEKFGDPRRKPIVLKLLMFQKPRSAPAEHDEMVNRAGAGATTDALPTR